MQNVISNVLSINMVGKIKKGTKGDKQKMFSIVSEEYQSTYCS